MDRTIKFRIWNHKKSSFGEDFWLYDSGHIDHDYEYCDDLTIQQYTGITDKNGVDIYEGDIVTITEVENLGVKDEFKHLKYHSQEHCQYQDITRKAEIIYQDEGWVGFKMRYFDWVYSSRGEERDGKRVEGFIDENCEVIGHIYENENNNE